jgi:hypothetical protein
MVSIVDSPLSHSQAPRHRTAAAEPQCRARGHSQWIVALGPRWVRAATVEHGHQRSPTVTDGSEEPQVAGPPAHAAAMTRPGDSDCGPEGQTQGAGRWRRRPSTPATAKPARMAVSIRRAGRTWSRNRVRPWWVLDTRCRVRRGTSALSPLVNLRCWPPSWMLRAPSRTSTRSSWRRCRWRGTRPPGSSRTSTSSSCPPRLLAGRAEPKMLTGEGVMQHAHRRLLAATLHYHHPQRRFGGRCPLNARPMIAARSS